MLGQAPRLFRALFWVMAYSLVIGTVFHGTFMARIFVEQAASTASSSTQGALLSFEPLVNLATIPLADFY